MVISTHIIKHERTYQGQIHPTCTYTVFFSTKASTLANHSVLCLTAYDIGSQRQSQ